MVKKAGSACGAVSSAQSQNKNRKAADIRSALFAGRKRKTHPDIFELLIYFHPRVSGSRGISSLHLWVNIMGETRGRSTSKFENKFICTLF